MDEDDLEEIDEAELESLELDLEDEESLEDSELELAMGGELDVDEDLGDLDIDEDSSDLEEADDDDELQALDAELEGLDEDLEDLEDLEGEDLDGLDLDEALDEDDLDLEGEESLDEGELALDGELDVDEELEDLALEDDPADLDETDDDLQALDAELAGLDSELAEDDEDLEDLDDEDLEGLDLDLEDEGELALDGELEADEDLEDLEADFDEEELAELDDDDLESLDLDDELDDAELALDDDLIDDDLEDLDDQELAEDDLDADMEDAELAQLEQELQDLEGDLSTEGSVLEGAAPEPGDLIDELMGPADSNVEESLGPEILGPPPTLGAADDALFAGPAATDTLGDEFFSGPAAPNAAVEPVSPEITEEEGDGENADQDDGLLDDLVIDDAEEEERLEPPSKEYRSSILEALRQVQKSDSVTSRAEVLSVLESAVPKEYRAAVSERRRLVRLSCQYDVNCYQGNQIFHATISDISLGGMKIEVSRQLEAGSELQVSNPNRSEGEPDERIAAQVRWFRVKDDGLAEVGLQFVDPPEVLGRSWVVSLLNKVGMQSQVFNQRKYTRATADFDIDIIDETGDVYAGRCVDLGLGGALVDTDPVFALNDIVTFRCRSFGVHGLLEAESRLVKVKHLDDQYGRYALEFENLDAPTTKLLGRYVVDLLKLGRGPRSS